MARLMFTFNICTFVSKSSGVSQLRSEKKKKKNIEHQRDNRSRSTGQPVVGLQSSSPSVRDRQVRFPVYDEETEELRGARAHCGAFRRRGGGRFGEAASFAKRFLLFASERSFLNTV